MSKHGHEASMECSVGFSEVVATGSTVGRACMAEAADTNWTDGADRGEQQSQQSSSRGSPAAVQQWASGTLSAWPGWQCSAV
jgi:hypothetical protein